MGVGIEEGIVGSVGGEVGVQAPTNRNNATTALSKTQGLYSIYQYDLLLSTNNRILHTPMAST